MSCNCTIYECLSIAPNVLQCGDKIVTTLLADESGTWLMRYEFNNRWFGENITVTDGELIELPYVFNEFYTHIIQLYRPDQTLFEDTCWTLDTAQIMGIAPASVSGGGATVGNISTITIDDYTSTFDVPGGRTVQLVFPGNQGYARDVDFTQSGTTITMLNGIVLSPGVITYIYL